ncbi:hypothetical protein QTO16_30175, partial [Vibrio harveyi]|uniref:hypothetical protein n=1 Tax=Vibrio harveyi TaxID=669 RepID=UPI002F3E646B
GERRSQAPNPTFSFKALTPPNLSLYQTPKLSTLRVQRGGTGFVLADNSVHNATAQRAESRF